MGMRQFASTNGDAPPSNRRLLIPGKARVSLCAAFINAVRAAQKIAPQSTAH
jgi:hypothetical protein